MSVSGLFEDAWIDLENSFFVSKGHNFLYHLRSISIHDGLDIVIYLLN